MAEITPPDSSKASSGAAYHAGTSTQATYSGGGASSSTGWGAIKKLFGEKDYNKFIQGICHQIAQDIGNQQKRAAEASRKLKISEEGKDPDAK